MTPVTWNDSEPGFPDFLPPKPAPVRLADDEAVQRLKGVLEAAGIELDGFLEAMDVKFPDGAVAVLDWRYIEANGYTRR
jgi:hypothetical protein